MNKIDLLYPVFLEICNYTDNTFWENIFEELAYGRCPSGSYFQGEYICSKIKNREFYYKLDFTKPSKTIYDELFYIFSEKMNILSSVEKKNIQNEYHRVEKKIKDVRKNWCDIKKKNIKETFVETYIIKMMKKYNLTITQTRKILSYILVSMSLKNIKNEDVIWDGEQILDIRGIKFINENYILDKSITSPQPKDVVHIHFVNKLMSDEWEKYIKNDFFNTPSS